MSKLLHVESSPRKERSASIAVAEDFLDAYRSAHPSDDVQCWDLWSDPLPDFDGATIDAKYRILHGHEHTPDEAAAWTSVVDIFERFNSADKYLFSVPMWNFGIPYRLKHFIDVITQPGLAFGVDPERGLQGLMTGRKAVIIYSRGSDYSAPSKESLDYQKPYLETWLRFIGVTGIDAVVVEPTVGDPGVVQQAREKAKGLATRKANEF